MSTDIYERHDRAFANVSAFVILKDGQKVATVAIKTGGAVTAFVHWLGAEMVAGRAGGGGYDRQTAAVANASRKLVQAFRQADAETMDRPPSETVIEARAAFLQAIESDRGPRWHDALRNAGFDVLQAV